MLVNQPTNDPTLFHGKALTYYGRWMYKYEEAARKGAIGAILIHRTDMAAYGWGVVRNSNSGEKSYLQLDGTAEIKGRCMDSTRRRRQTRLCRRSRPRQDDG